MSAIREQEFLRKIEEACDIFLKRNLSLQHFQNIIEGNLSNYENEIALELRNRIDQFIAKIELDRFMYDSPEKEAIIDKKVEILLDQIKPFFKEK